MLHRKEREGREEKQKQNTEGGEMPEIQWAAAVRSTAAAH
jgi:hypothetical protein